jgi:hypothetical protein
VKAAERGSLLCVREEGNRRKEKKIRKEKEEKGRKKRKKIWKKFQKLFWYKKIICLVINK